MINNLTSIINKFKKFDPTITSDSLFIQEYICENGIKGSFINY